MQINKIRFKVIGDDRGNLIALEQCVNIPFEIKRVYYMYGTQTDYARGKHAHKTLEQVLICINGSCEILLDDGNEKEILFLNRRDEGVYIGPGTWCEMYHFSQDAVIMVVASELYDESDYIRDYGDFIKWVNREEEGKSRCHINTP